MTRAKAFKEYTKGDKEALRELAEEYKVKLPDMIDAVEPDLKTPASLVNS